jgi:hypothetical protein
LGKQNFMNKTQRIFILLAAIAGGASTSAFANNYVYSYTFTNGDVASGTFIGTPEASGVVDHLTDVTLNINGAPVSGTVYTATYDGSDWVNGATLSDDLPQNDFLFINSDYADGQGGYSAYFQMVDMETYVGAPGISGHDNPDLPGSWYFVDPPSPGNDGSNSVPDSAATFLLLGASLVGLALFRRHISDITVTL